MGSISVHDVRVLIKNYVEIQPIHAIIRGNPIIVVIDSKHQSVSSKTLHHTSYHDAHTIIENHDTLTTVDIRNGHHVRQGVEAEVVDLHRNLHVLLFAHGLRIGLHQHAAHDVLLRLLFQILLL